MKIAITGSRQIQDTDAIEGVLMNLVKQGDILVHGGAKGVDQLCEKWAMENNVETIQVLPNYGKYGKKAPLMRNGLIVQRAELVIAFWNGESHGTKDTINKARILGKRLLVVMC